MNMLATTKAIAQFFQPARNRLLARAVVAVLLPVLLPAVQVYVDATGDTGGNTYNNANNSLTGWYVRSSTAFITDNLWGNRTGGSAVSAYNSDDFELYTQETGAILRTEVSGLLPNTTYTGLRVYMLGSTTANYNWTLDVSLDGVNWTTYSDYDAPGFTGTVVNTANNGVGVPLTGTQTGTKRFWHALPNAATTAAGVLRFYIRKGTGSANRSVYDGVGYDNAIPAPPTLGTASASAVLDTSATLSGIVASDGGLPITKRGFVFSPTAINPNPTLGGSGVTDLPVAGTTGEYAQSVTGLTATTSYSFKAYATNANGAAYSATATFTTALTTDPYSTTVAITEFLADNPGPVNLPGSVLDMDTDSSDWIELHNSGTTIADLSGWKLTNDPLQPGKWTFPAGISIQPGARLLIFASGKNRRLAGVELHTNFKLANTGFIQLSRPDPSATDAVLSTISYYAQSSRASYGTATNPPEAPAFGYFVTPTPGTANPASAVPGFVSSPATDIDRGLFSAPFSVTLSCSVPGATILYTLDGSIPVEGAPATAAIPPADDSSLPVGSISISGTTILRARSVKVGLGPSKVDTHTYLFPAQVLTQTAPPAHFPPSTNWSHYGTSDWPMDPNIVNHASPESRCTVDDLLAIPSVSLVMDWSELFGTAGIYPAKSPVPQEGLDKAANLELLNSGGNPASPNSGEPFSVQGRTHIFGGTSQQRWKVDKLSMNFNVVGSVGTGVYGDTATGTYGTFILDARMGNTWLHSTDDEQRTRGDYIRDEVAAETQRLQGYAGTHSRRIHLYLNGMYWGLYTLHEKPSADFQAAYQGGDPGDWDVLKHSPLRDDCLDSGTFVNPALAATVKTNNTAYVNYQAMLATVATGVNLTSSTNYAAVGAKLDIDAFIDYILLNFYLGNFDWSHQNWYGSYRRNHPDGRWRFHSWDAEHVLRTEKEDFSNNNQNATPTFIHQRLATNAEYRMRFADRMHKWFFNGGLFTTEKLTEICNRQFAEIDAAMRCESARWGDNRAPARAAPNTNITYTRGVEWLNEKNRMLDVVVPARNSLILNSLKAKPNALYPRVDPTNTASAVFHAPAYAQHGGRVPAGHTLTITNSNGGLGVVLYTLDGSDPRLTGGAVSPSALTYSDPVPLAGSVTVRSRTYLGGVWSALNEATFSVGTVAPASGNLIISKIMWKPAPPTEADELAGFSDDSEFEFLELYNPSSNPVDLTGIQIDHGLDIAPMATGPEDLAPGGRAVLVAKPSAFLHRYGPGLRVIGKFINGSNLSGSERVTLLDANGTVLTSFVYNNTSTNPWPKTETSGTGAALVLINPETNPNPALGTNWRASLATNPAPAFDDRPNLSLWQTTYFGGPTDLAADPDHDGRSNLIEFALGLHPLSASEAPERIPVFSVTTTDPGTGLQTEVTLSYCRLRFLETLDWSIDASTSLGDWTVNPSDLMIVSILAHADGTETITYRSTMPGSIPIRFFRLHVTTR
jgi:hypothetical protein